MLLIVVFSLVLLINCVFFSSGGGRDVWCDVDNLRNVVSVRGGIRITAAIISWAHIYQITSLIPRDVALALAQPIVVVEQVLAVISEVAASCGGQVNFRAVNTSIRDALVEDALVHLLFDHGVVLLIVLEEPWCGLTLEHEH